MRNLLSSEQKRMIHQIQDAVDEITETLTHLDIDKQDRRMLRRAIYQLNELFLFVVVGEFNSGKSMFINSIVGSTQCETGVLPTTDHLHILKYGDTEQHSVEEDDIHVSHLPVELLKEANIVDTPGTNAILRHHQAITEHFVPRSDIICFVTSVDRPFSESERQFLQVRIPRYAGVAYTVKSLHVYGHTSTYE